MLIYKTEPWAGNSDNDYYWIEYRKESRVIAKYRCHRWLVLGFNGNEWKQNTELLNAWNIDDDDLPEWLKGII